MSGRIRIEGVETKKGLPSNRWQAQEHTYFAANPIRRKSTKSNLTTKEGRTVGIEKLTFYIVVALLRHWRQARFDKALVCYLQILEPIQPATQTGLQPKAKQHVPKQRAH